jgi:hypothetical protein
MGGRRLLVAGLVLVLVAGAVVGTAYVMRGDQEDIFLEDATSVGPNPFTDDALASAQDVQTTTTSAPAESTTTIAGPTTTALFGGSGDQKVCDPEALIAYLEANPDKAAAWVAALNADPTMKWSGGDELEVSDIPEYIRELTPAFLAKDTRVTNHGFLNGRATPRQSVLQAGTAVLVDKDGVPRARCACGNPLIPPKKVDNPHYEGDCWLDETTTTTTSSTTTSTSTSTSTTSTTVPTNGFNPSLGTLDGVEMELAWARPSNRCGDEPYCSPPGCVATTTTVDETTTTSSSTTTTSTTTPNQLRGGRTTTTQRRTTQPTTATTATTAPSTTQRTVPTTQQTTPNQGSTSSIVPN